MEQYATPALTALLALLIPGVIRWMGKRIEEKLSGFNDRVIAAVESMDRRMSLMESAQVRQDNRLSFLEGVQSERSTTAKAVLEAAKLVAHPLDQTGQSE